MRYPKKLNDGGCIGFVAPSFGCATEPYISAFASAKKKLTDLGYTTITGPNCYASDGIGISTEPCKCGQELNDMYIRSHAGLILPCGGGEMMCEVIPYMDIEGMKQAEPKWYMGYSDNTNFTFISATLLDTAAMYGPCAPAFGMEPWHKSLTDALNIMSGKENTVTGYDAWEITSLKSPDDPLRAYNTTEKTRIRHAGSCAAQYTDAGDDPAGASAAGMNGSETSLADNPLQFDGRLLGGCVDCLTNLVGTRFDKVKEFNDRYSDDGVIWFLECCDLNPMSLRRAMWQLREAGWFDRAKAFLIGRSLHYGEEMFGTDMYAAYTDMLKDFNVPIIMDLDIGHLPPMMPIMCGGTAQVRVSGESISLTYTYR